MNTSICLDNDRPKFNLEQLRMRLQNSLLYQNFPSFQKFVTLQHCGSQNRVVYYVLAGTYGNDNMENTS